MMTGMSQEMACEPAQLYIQDIFQQQQQAFKFNTYPSVHDRKKQLVRLKQLLLQYKPALLVALSADFGHRSEDDSKLGDILPCILALNSAIKKCASWMRPQRRHVDLIFQPASAAVHYQPVGVVGIIVPWNYPVFMSIGPLISALAAGNRVMIKLSEYTPHTNQVLSAMLSEGFRQDEVAVIEGAANVGQIFSQQPFNHILFTGSTRVGRKIMQAAAENLTPVTLELGGKSPCIIDDDFPIKEAAKRLLFGKTLNAGQTCVTTDYILCPRNQVDSLVDALQTEFTKLYPDFANNTDYCHIINQTQYNRLQQLLTQAKQQGAIFTPLATITEDSRKMPLTLVLNTSEDMELMQQELFGPILPIIPYDDINQAFEWVESRDRPLALYLFSYDKHIQQRCIERTHAGGMCINETTIHVAIDDLPFGGTGTSGMGNYHGREGFETFSNKKSVVKRGKLSFMHLIQPPYGNSLQKWFYKLFLR